MKIKTITQFCNESRINSDLIRAVIRQSGGWQSFKESAPDIYNHGASGGYYGWIYNSDTVAFFEKNRTIITELLKERADDFGMGMFEMIAGFRCLSGLVIDDIAAAMYEKENENRTYVLNALAWFACEEVASNYCDLQER